jgi:hypothetical protein
MSSSEHPALRSEVLEYRDGNAAARRHPAVDPERGIRCDANAARRSWSSMRTFLEEIFAPGA